MDFSCTEPQILYNLDMETKKAIGYLRVSTEDQVNSGLGLEAQRGSILKVAKQMSVNVADFYLDEAVGGAASVDKRLGLMNAIEALRTGDVLIVAKRDRLARDTMLSCWLEKEVQKRGARIISAAGEGTESDEPTAILMRRIVDAFAEYERQVIRARTKAALQAKRKRGEKTGGTLEYGFNLAADGKTLLKNNREQKNIALIVKLRKSGKTLQAISDELHKRSIKSKTNKRWQCQSISNIYKRAVA